MNRYVKLSFALLIGISLAGCSSEKAASSMFEAVGGIDPITNPTTCPDLSGHYQMNADMFTVRQDKCNTLEVEKEYGTFASRKYILDGIERVVNGKRVSSQFTGDVLVVTTKDSSPTVLVEQYRLTHLACGFPDDGSFYLERKYSTNGTFNNSNCDSWWLTSTKDEK